MDLSFHGERRGEERVCGYHVFNSHVRALFAYFSVLFSLRSLF
jgi:hypothetical protein